MMHLGIDFWKDFGELWEGKWRHVGIQIASKIDPNFEERFLKKTFVL